MILSTTPTISGKNIVQYKGIVTSEVIMGANVFRDMVAGLSDFFGGRAGVYEDKLKEGKDVATSELISRAQALGANAVVGVDIDYETIGRNGSMLMISMSGTAVVLE